MILKKGDYLARLEGLVTERVISVEKLEQILQEAISLGRYPEDRLLEEGVPKHQILNCLFKYYTVPAIEYNEGLLADQGLLKQFSQEELKKALWLPLTVNPPTARVIAYSPDDPELIDLLKTVLKVVRIDWLVTLPSDLIQMIENNYDVNPNFPPSAGRTPLAEVRTSLAEWRTRVSWYRTHLAKGRTGLSFLRTGISFITIAMVMLRVLGLGFFTLIEVLLLLTGLLATMDGLFWYLPARKIGKEAFPCKGTESTFGTTFLELNLTGDSPDFQRVGPIKGATELRSRWMELSPVMKRRFLASDRTDLAEERTVLAFSRTMMAKARTGLAFTRTGLAFTGLGIGLFRQFSPGWLTFFDGFLIFLGTAMVLEGIHWYMPGRQISRFSLKAIGGMEKKLSIWEFMFPSAYKRSSTKYLPSLFPIRRTHQQGIWGTTGLALERTLLAERRNVQSRLRTIMAHSRTGLSLLRTGAQLFFIGFSLLVYFGFSNTLWMFFNLCLMVGGLSLAGNGFYYHVPAERIRRQFPYCYGDMEINIPDYGKPAADWEKIHFSHEKL
jgi:uncharacterized membrane protein YidH (DUF202 family)